LVKIKTRWIVRKANFIFSFSSWTAASTFKGFKLENKMAFTPRGGSRGGGGAGRGYPSVLRTILMLVASEAVEEEVVGVLEPGVVV